MSLARREPLLHARVHDTAAYPGDTAHARGPIRGFTRFMTVMQLTGSLLGIPIGLASGYAIYRANFAADATCQTLRSNILATLDRSVDAATRRMLVHRDVATFERSCGVSDPDAAAAFKGLLVADKAKAPMIAVTPRAEVKPKDVARKDAPRSIAAAPDRRDASDAAWVAAVREALLTEGTQPSAHPAAAKKACCSRSAADAARYPRGERSAGNSACGRAAGFGARNARGRSPRSGSSGSAGLDPRSFARGQCSTVG